MIDEIQEGEGWNALTAPLPQFFLASIILRQSNRKNTTLYQNLFFLTFYKMA